MQKFYSFNPAVVASELHRATRPTAAPRYSVSSIVIAQSRQTLNVWLACMHVPEFKAGRDWRVAQRFQYKWHEGVARGRVQPHALRHAAYVVVSSVRSALRGWSHLIAPNDCCRLWLGMADNWVIRKYANVMQCRGWEFHELHRDAACKSRPGSGSTGRFPGSSGRGPGNGGGNGRRE